MEHLHRNLGPAGTNVHILADPRTRRRPMGVSVRRTAASAGYRDQGRTETDTTGETPPWKGRPA